MPSPAPRATASGWPASGTGSSSSCSTPAASTSPTRASWPRTCSARPGSASPRPRRSCSSSTAGPACGRATPSWPRPCAAAHGLGSGDLLDRAVELLGERPAPADRGEAVQIAVVGRPNAGKSSLVNAFLGSERVIVSERAGTTRDAIDTELEVEGRPLLLVDTAGLRRRSKVAGTVDYYAQLRSELAVEQ